MPTITFYGRQISATARNVKLLMLVYSPAVFVLMFSAYFLSAWALSDFLNIGLWLTLPLVVLLCMQFTGNSRTVALLPTALRGPVLHCFMALALYVFWKDGAYVKFSVVALFAAHLVANKTLTAFWTHQEKKAAALARIGDGLTDLGYDQRTPTEDSNPKL